MPDAWSEYEVERAVDVYFQMFRLELEGQTFSKVDYYRPVSSAIGRSEGSVEYKFSNISAVLVELGATFVEGYKPLSNVQGLLREKVRERFDAEPQLRRLLIRMAETPVQVVNEGLGNPSPVPMDLVLPRRGPIERRGRFVDFNALEARNAQRGLTGERLLVHRERRFLSSVGRADLAAKVRHVSIEDGDGLGYDVLSFRPDGVERFLEVKTTVRSEHQPFHVTRNEVDFSDEEPERFTLVRIFHLGRRPGFYELEGSLKESAQLEPDSWIGLPRPAAGT